MQSKNGQKDVGASANTRKGFSNNQAQDKKKDDVETISDISDEKWTRIARDTNMLYGIVVESREPGLAMARASSPVLVWEAPSDKSFATNEAGKAEIASYASEISEECKIVESGHDIEKAKLKVPFLSLSFEHKTEQKKVSESKSKKIYMTGSYHFPRARVELSECKVVSKDFIKDIETALEYDDKEINQRELKKVLKKYGHLISMTVTLGGRLNMSETEKKDSYRTVDDYKETFGMAVEFKVKKVSGGADAGTEKETDKEKKAKQYAKSCSFVAIGGDTTLVNKPEEWEETVKPAENWQIIERSDYIRTIDLLPNDLKKKADSLWTNEERAKMMKGHIPPLRLTPGIMHKADCTTIVSAWREDGDEKLPLKCYVNGSLTAYSNCIKQNSVSFCVPKGCTFQVNAYEERPKPDKAGKEVDIDIKNANKGVSIYAFLRPFDDTDERQGSKLAPVEKDTLIKNGDRFRIITVHKHATGLKALLGCYMAPEGEELQLACGSYSTWEERTVSCIVPPFWNYRWNCEEVSYALGMDIGRKFEKGEEFSPTTIEEAIIQNDTIHQWIAVVAKGDSKNDESQAVEICLDQLDQADWAVVCATKDKFSASMLFCIPPGCYCRLQGHPGKCTYFKVPF